MDILVCIVWVNLHGHQRQIFVDNFWVNCGGKYGWIWQNVEILIPLSLGGLVDLYYLTLSSNGTVSLRWSFRNPGHLGFNKNIMIVTLINLSPELLQYIGALERSRGFWGAEPT